MTPGSGIPLERLLDSHSIVNVQDATTLDWHSHPIPPPPAPDFPSAVLAQHQANFELWHLEDEARTPQADDARIAQVKRSIDRVNQRRNDLMEKCDALLLEALGQHGLPVYQAPLHSETPGLILDRLSILSLKIFHTREETLRPDASSSHLYRNHDRLHVLEEQRRDLAQCLDRLWEQVVHGDRRFKLYRQLKMYNDPSLNPSVYKKLEG
jgi:hypothetical protein